jgi:RND family efflux transporter MFP subunit
MDKRKSTINQEETETTTRGKYQKGLKIILPFIIVSIGIAGAVLFNKTAPKARKRPPAKMSSVVRVKKVHPSTHKLLISAMGTVIPARQIKLKSRVSGEVIETDPEFVVGGLLPKGTKALQIDPEDYKLALARKQSQVADASFELKIELGRQDVAKREWELLNNGGPSNNKDIALALRKPHLNKAKADLNAAKAELKQAGLNLSRTTIRAPFNAIVRTKNIELGSQVSPQDQLAELVETDEYWIMVSIPVDRLKWISLPKDISDTGAKVRIKYRKGNTREGYVVRLLGDLETKGRMARVIVSVIDPLDLKNPSKKRAPLLIGEYVHLEIEGQELNNVTRIPRTALRENNHIWVAGNDKKLRIKTVEVVWKDTKTVFLRNGLQPDDRLIVSDLSAPVNGMPLKIVGSNKETTPLKTIPPDQKRLRRP